MIVDVRFPLRSGAAAGLLALALTAVQVAAQSIPDDFTNLEVLPEDISRRERPLLETEPSLRAPVFVPSARAIRCGLGPGRVL